MKQVRQALKAAMAVKLHASGDDRVAQQVFTLFREKGHPSFF